MTDIARIMEKAGAVLTYDADGKGPFAYKSTDNGEAVLLLADTKFLYRIPCPELEGRVDGMIGFPAADVLSAVDGLNYVAGFTSGGAPVATHPVKTREDSIRTVYGNMLAARPFCTMQIEENVEFSEKAGLVFAGEPGKLIIREKGKDLGARGDCSARFGLETNTTCVKGFLVPGAQVGIAMSAKPGICYLRIDCPDGTSAFSTATMMSEKDLKELLDIVPAEKIKPKKHKEIPVTAPTSNEDTLPVPPGVPADLPAGATSVGDGSEATDTQKTQETKTTPEEAIEQLMQLVDMAKTLETSATELRREVSLRVKKAKTVLSPLLRSGDGKSTALEAENARLKQALVKFEKVKEAMRGI